jgi:tetratricopeptide (TPR) repeat protein
VIHDNEGAIVAWRARLDDNPGDHTALTALDRLYDGAERWRELVDVLERRRDITEQPNERRGLMTRSAETLWHRLGAIPAAIDAYQALLDQFGPDESSLGSLESLYTSAERWDELAETLERHLEIAESSESQLSILVRLGDLRREHLADLDGALEAYRRALDLDASHGPSRAALERLLEADQNVARREAAQILHPNYEADGDHERLLKVLEIEITTSEDPLERLERYKAAIGGPGQLMSAGPGRHRPAAENA